MENVYLKIVMQNDDDNRKEQLSNIREETSEYREITVKLMRRTKTDEIHIYGGIHIPCST